MEGLLLVVMQMFFSCYQMIELIFGKILTKRPFFAKVCQKDK
jgi:hypothetical protein